MKQTAIYPGSFDPITYGHLDLIKRATQIFDRVTVAVAGSSLKIPLFNLEERLAMIKAATRRMKGLKVETFDGLVVDYARQKNVRVIIRGLRMLSDFEYEFQMALTNRRLAEDVETVFLMPSERYSFLSSTLLKQAASLGADLSSFVPAFIEKKLKERLMGSRKVSQG